MFDRSDRITAAWIPVLLEGVNPLSFSGQLQ